MIRCLITQLAALLCAVTVQALQAPIIFSSEARSALHHLQESFPQWKFASAVQDLANTNIPRRDGGTVLAYQVGQNNNNDRLLILLHEFFGLSQSICDKANALAQELDCTVIAPDTFRGDSSTFIPKCIWLALSTPQERVNQDLDDVLAHYQSTKNTDTSNVAVMGFCYGGGKAIRYTTECQPTAATVVCYGSPVTDVESLARLQKPVCGIFGRDDLQFPMSLVDQFDAALKEARVVKSDVTVYDGVGHAFWKDMEQIEQKEQPQYDAYRRVVGFLKQNL